MKLTCDLCNSSLQMNSGGQDATCVGCGLTYSMERLREKLKSSVKSVPVEYEEPTKWIRVYKAYNGGIPLPEMDFRMTVEDVAARGECLVVTGTVEDGSICVDMSVQVNGTKIGKVVEIERSGRTCHLAQAGDTVALFLSGLKKEDVRPGDVLTYGCTDVPLLEEDFRLSVEKILVNAAGRLVVSGTVEAGKVSERSSVKINGAKVCKVDTINRYNGRFTLRMLHDSSMSEARVGDCVALNLIGLNEGDIAPGDILTYTSSPWTLPSPPPAPVVEQFVMQLEPGKGDFSGIIKQGGVGLGDEVYLDGDESHPYVVYSINDDSECWSAQAGSRVDLYVSQKVPKKLVKKAQFLTGKPDPVENAYNFQGETAEYFTRLLRREFAGFELRMNESFSLDGVDRAADYVLYLDGIPKVAVFLMSSCDRSARYYAKKAEKFLGEAGIGATHFFWNYRNDAPYVVERIRKALMF